MKCYLKQGVLYLMAVFIFVSPAFPKDTQEEEGFFYPKDLPLKPANLENAYKASVDFSVGFSNCSAAYISPDGYLLTAFHCVISALGIESRYRQKLTNDAEVVIVPPLDVVGQPYISWTGEKKGMVVAVGQGFGQFDEREVHKYDSTVLPKILSVIGTDWAILKMDNVQNHTCLVAAELSPQEGEYSWTIGYPAATQRNVGEKTNNYKKLVSFGKVSYSADETEFYKTLLPLNRKIVLDFWNALVAQKEFFLSDSDSQGGNSGSPTINADAALTGVLVQGLMPNQEFSYQSFHTYSSGIIDLQSIRRTLGEEQFGRYFTCRETI